MSESEEPDEDQAGHPVRDARTGRFQAGVGAAFFARHAQMEFGPTAERRLKAAADGEISTSDAASLGSIVGNVARAMELNQIVCRLDELERRLSEKG